MVESPTEIGLDRSMMDSRRIRANRSHNSLVVGSIPTRPTAHVVRVM